MDTIKQIRLSKSLTQQQVAFKSGLNLNTYICIEKGLGNPRLDTIIALAKALDIKPCNVVEILCKSKLANIL